MTATTFPWEALPRIGRAEAALTREAAQLAAGGAAARRAVEAALTGVLGAPVVITPGPIWASSGHELARSLGHPGGVVVCGGAPGAPDGAMWIDGRLATRVVARALGLTDPALVVARALAPAEEAILSAIVARALEALAPRAAGVCLRGVGIPSADVLGGAAPAACVDLAVTVGDTAGAVRVVLPAGCLGAAPPPTPSPGALDVLAVRVEVLAGAAAIPLAAIFALAPGDVVVPDALGVDARGHGTVTLRHARGAHRATLDGARLTILGPAPGGPMPPTPDPRALDDVPVELAVRLAELTLSAREILELAPGAIVTLGRAPGAAVELVSAGRVVARGDLVQVDGELGLRVRELPGT